MSKICSFVSSTSLHHICLRSCCKFDQKLWTCKYPPMCCTFSLTTQLCWKLTHQRGCYSHSSTREQLSFHSLYRFYEKGSYCTVVELMWSLRVSRNVLQVFTWLRPSPPQWTDEPAHRSAAKLAAPRTRERAWRRGQRHGDTVKKKPSPSAAEETERSRSRCSLLCSCQEAGSKRLAHAHAGALATVFVA